jgi:hypothetical protein
VRTGEELRERGIARRSDWLAAATPATTLTDATFANGEFGPYDFSNQRFDNVVLVSPVPEPSSLFCSEAGPLRPSGVVCDGGVPNVSRLWSSKTFVHLAICRPPI